MTGTANTTFKLYSAATGGSALWTETIALSFDGGHYSVTLGATTDLEYSYIDGSDLWLGITIEGANEFAPRSRITSTLYSMRAGIADEVDGPVNAQDGLQINGTTIIDANGNWVGGDVGIGTTNPEYTLDVDGTINATEVLVNGQPIEGSGGGSGPNLYSIEDSEGAEAEVIYVGEEDIYTLVGSGFGSSPIIKIFNTSMTPTGSVSSTAIETDFTLADFHNPTSICVINTDTNQRSNYIHIPSRFSFNYGGTGVDGEITVDSSNQTINDYTSLSQTVPQGATVIPVADNGVITDNEEIMLIQIKGENSGTYEFVHAVRQGSDLLSLTPILHDYNAGGENVTMIVRIPQFTDVTINSSSSMIADAWDGTIGGVVAFRASGTVNIIGSVNATGKGYRQTPKGTCWAGESYQGGYNTAHSPCLGNNYGGGGGRDNPGCPEPSAGGGGYGSQGGTGSQSSGSNPGGTGGDSYGSENLSSIFFGSSGGSSNDGTGTGGGGGGIIYITAGQINVQGSIVSNGGNGGNGVHDGMGGGAGGSIYLGGAMISVTGTVTAQGGNGGTAETCGANSVFGGDGGEGRIRIDAGTFEGSTDPSAYLGEF